MLAFYIITIAIYPPRPKLYNKSFPGYFFSPIIPSTLLIKLLTSNFSGSILNFTFKQVTERGKHASLIKGIKNIHPLKRFLQALNKSHAPHKVSFSSFSTHNLSVSTLMRKRCLIERWKNMRAAGGVGGSLGGPLKSQVSLRGGRGKALALSSWAPSRAAAHPEKQRWLWLDPELRGRPGPCADCLVKWLRPSVFTDSIAEEQKLSFQGQPRVLCSTWLGRLVSFWTDSQLMVSCFVRGNLVRIPYRLVNHQSRA